MKELIKYLVMLVIIGIITDFITTNVILLAYVPSESMEDTLHVGDIVIADRLAKEYNRGDIAIFYHEESESLYIKRVIGTPGDEVVIRDNTVFLNGEQLEEPYLKETMDTEGELSYHVPEDCYFMLGDNRNYSDDSREWEDPFVTREAMAGKAVVRIWPLSRAGGL